MTRKHVVIAASVAVILLGGGTLVRQKTIAKTTASTIQTATVKRDNFIQSVSSSGKTKAVKSVDLKFQTSGRLAWVGVSEGDHVDAWQTIATLDTREVQKNLDKALHDYASERNTFEETWRVTYNGVSNPSTALTDTIKRVLEKNQWDLEKSVLDVELKSLALEYSKLVTPIAGIVTHIDTPLAGVNITPAGSVFTVVDPASIVFEVNADETDVGLLSLGQKAEITLDAYPNATFSGTVSYISYSSEISAGGATVFPVRVSFDEPKSIRIGLNGDVTIQSSLLPDALTVPIEAVREEAGTKYVYKKVGSTYKKTTITTGPQNDTTIVVTHGVSEGDTVVTKGFTNVK